MATDPSILARLPAFAAVSEASLAPLAQAAERVRMAAGSVLFRIGEPAHHLYFVLEGRVTLSLALPGRSELSVLSLGPLELTGWSGLLPHARAATARITEDAELLRLPGALLLSACEADHELGYRVMRYLFADLTLRLRDARLQLVDAYGERHGGG